MSYYLAIDSGGTKADYVLADNQRELARVRSGTIKRMRGDEATCAAHLNGALNELAALSGISLRNVTRICIGTAGHKVPLVADWLCASLASRVSGELILLGDIEIALDAAFPGKTGVVVIAGTGSNVAGRDAQGHIITAGGWGPALADQGSGHRIGLEALRATFLAIDEGRSTLLLPAILNLWQLTSIDRLVEHANRIPAPDFSRLTQTAVLCAQHGDLIASAVLRSEGEALAYLVRLVLRRLRLAEGDDACKAPLAFTGSILEKVSPVRDALISAVQKEFPAIEVCPGVIDPVTGALWRARAGR
jgi:N-acetylglucosamine kinase-like BadF-type ATPase